MLGLSLRQRLLVRGALCRPPSNRQLSVKDPNPAEPVMLVRVCGRTKHCAARVGGWGSFLAKGVKLEFTSLQTAYVHRSIRYFPSNGHMTEEYRPYLSLRTTLLVCTMHTRLWRPTGLWPHPDATHLPALGTKRGRWRSCA